jgi:hypothetical protein
MMCAVVRRSGLSFYRDGRGLQGGGMDRVMVEAMNVLQCCQLHTGSKRERQFQEGSKRS